MISDFAPLPQVSCEHIHALASTVCFHPGAQNWYRFKNALKMHIFIRTPFHEHASLCINSHLMITAFNIPFWTSKFPPQEIGIAPDPQSYLFLPRKLFFLSLEKTVTLLSVFSSPLPILCFLHR